MKDAVATMGNLLPDDAGGRDAVHVAVFSAVSRERLFPSQAIVVLAQEGTDVTVGAASAHEMVGVAIVDPFLASPVLPGSRFWAYLYPRTITALSHRWSHPAFEETSSVYAPPADKLTSEQWLRQFIKEEFDDPDDGSGYYTSFVELAQKIAEGCTDFFVSNNDGWGGGMYYDDEAICFNGHTNNNYDIPTELWHHLEVIIGKKLDGKKPTYFRCAC